MRNSFIEQYKYEEEKIMILQFFTVFFTAMFELWVAIPIGIGFKLEPITIIMATSLGATIGSIFVILLGNGIRN